MDTDQKQAEEHVFKCSCGNECIGHCEHCDRPCKKKRCRKCKKQIPEFHAELKGLRDMGKDAA